MMHMHDFHQTLHLKTLQDMAPIDGLLIRLLLVGSTALAGVDYAEACEHFQQTGLTKMRICRQMKPG